MSVKTRVLLPEIQEVGVGAGGVGVAVPAARVDVDQAIRLVHGQRPEQGGIDDREERRIEPDADRQRRDRHDGEGGAVQEPSEGVANVGAKVGEHFNCGVYGDRRFAGSRFLPALNGPMTLARQQLGKIGEDLAVSELERRGYAITARRYRTPCGEIDIVAECEGVLVFVEVKAQGRRRIRHRGRSRDPWKQRRLTRMANDYLTRERVVDRPCRFDVVTVMFDRPEPIIEVYENAFDAC